MLELLEINFDVHKILNRHGSFQSVYKIRLHFIRANLHHFLYHLHTLAKRRLPSRQL